ncbi:TPA: hypothetical protein DCL30_02255 [Candidatus Peribacteria bacterium]|nr:MAG: hypothetical protein A3J91_04045 [Candidatus Peribacteria bacterium RIFOXYC2_FULL_58_10]OGJ84577.1 MAG: hypothetical protein A2529_06000 [Candidatus Peribacteria bacterium RIFOXYD2_FULL_58_15]HAI98348.1 hypothetical protein [Candidatus Peribacteria bacterium]HAS33769.1 hypothetical protein [Candidatus Peribacteria bacterium]
MRNRGYFLVSALSILTILGGCAQSGSPTETTFLVSGAKSGAYTAVLAATTPLGILSRPSSALGTFVSLYLSQGKLLKVHAALRSIDVQMTIFHADASVDSNETFALLQEYGSVLQVNVIDTLNRALDRREFLDTYLQSLEALNIRITAKVNELKLKLDDLGKLRKEQRNTAYEIERTLNKAMKAGDYSAVGEKQQELVKAQKTVAETESLEKEARRIRDLHTKLLKVGEERWKAISVNREILIAGLKVIEVPGIENLGILQQGK